MKTVQDSLISIIENIEQRNAAGEITWIVWSNIEEFIDKIESLNENGE